MSSSPPRFPPARAATWPALSSKSATGSAISLSETRCSDSAFQRSSHATHTVVPVDQLIHKPAQLGWEVAGSLYVVGATAYAAVHSVAPQPGETVAVSAAAGGVGSLVVQLLALRDVRVLGIASARQCRVAARSWRHPRRIRRRVGRTIAGGRAGRYRCLHRPVRAGLCPARRRPRCGARADRHHHLLREGRRSRREDRGQRRGVDAGGADRNRGLGRLRRGRLRHRRHLPARPGRRCLSRSSSSGTPTAKSFSCPEILLSRYRLERS